MSGVSLLAVLRSSLAMITLGVITLGCAAQYGGKRNIGKIIVEGHGQLADFYLVRPYDFESKIQPLARRDPEQAQVLLDDTTNLFRASGQTIYYEPGTYRMVFFCEKQMVSVLVQIPISTKSTDLPSVYKLECPR